MALVGIGSAARNLAVSVSNRPQPVDHTAHLPVQPQGPGSGGGDFCGVASPLRDVSSHPLSSSRLPKNQLMNILDKSLAERFFYLTSDS